MPSWFRGKMLPYRQQHQETTSKATSAMSPARLRRPPAAKSKPINELMMVCPLVWTRACRGKLRPPHRGSGQLDFRINRILSYG